MENSLCHISMLVEYGKKIHKKLAILASWRNRDTLALSDPLDSQALLITISDVLNCQATVSHRPWHEYESGKNSS